jgi:hypothetical protein
VKPSAIAYNENATRLVGTGPVGLRTQASVGRLGNVAGVGSRREGIDESTLGQKDKAGILKSMASRQVFQIEFSYTGREPLPSPHYGYRRA